MSEGARSPLKLELKTVMSCHLGAVSWTRFLWKSSLHSTPSPHTFKQPIFTWFFSFTLSADWCLLFVVPLMKYTFPCSLPLKTGFSVAILFLIKAWFQKVPDVGMSHVKDLKLLFFNNVFICACCFKNKKLLSWTCFHFCRLSISWYLQFTIVSDLLISHWKASEAPLFQYAVMDHLELNDCREPNGLHLVFTSMAYLLQYIQVSTILLVGNRLWTLSILIPNDSEA